MTDITDMAVDVEVQRFDYYTGDVVAYVRMELLTGDGWTDWSVVRGEQ